MSILCNKASGLINSLIASRVLVGMKKNTPWFFFLVPTRSYYIVLYVAFFLSCSY